MFECRRTNIMGSLVQDASPFLFPCTIEYSLICAAILYVMWKNISKAGIAQPATPPGARHHAQHAYRYAKSIPNFKCKKKRKEQKKERKKTFKYFQYTMKKLINFLKTSGHSLIIER